MTPQDLRDKLAFEYFEASLYVDGILDAFKAGYDARDTDLAALTKEKERLKERLRVVHCYSSLEHEIRNEELTAECTRSAELFAAEVARLNDLGEEVAERMNFWRASSQAYKAQALALAGALDRLTMKMNPMTSQHRHGDMVTQSAMTKVCNAQLDAEAALAAWDAFLKARG